MQPFTIDDAETELREAIDHDDAAAIKRIEPVIDALDVHPSAPSLHSAALYYASTGLHVFPLQPGSKVPTKGSHGCLDATTDIEQINAWWGRTPEANIGIATGHLVDVVDIDGHAGQRSRVENWEEIFEHIDDDAIGKVLTPRQGGMHVYVRATGDGNATNIVPSVDYRGVGGYVVAPPSLTPAGKYQWLGTPRLADLAQGSAA